MSTEANEIHAFKKLLAQFDTAMLVTQSLESDIRARPMHVAGHSEDGGIYFTTRSEDVKLKEILSSPNVGLTFQADGQYLSVSGLARIETDTLLAEKLWSPAMRAWFPDGPDDAEYTVIEVMPRKAEFWDRTGVRKLELLWEMGRAVVLGEEPDDRSLSGHGKVSFETPTED
jgi:general stress protein 26